LASGSVLESASAWVLESASALGSVLASGLV
jgi:hypothetical protein